MGEAYRPPADSPSLVLFLVLLVLLVVLIVYTFIFAFLDFSDSRPEVCALATERRIRVATMTMIKRRRRSRKASLLSRALLHPPSDQHPLNLVRPLNNLQHFCVTHQLFNLILFDISGPTQKLNSISCYAHCAVGGKALSHRGK